MLRRNAAELLLLVFLVLVIIGATYQTLTLPY